MWVISARKCQSARYRVHGARERFPAGHCQTRKCAEVPLSARRSLWCDLGFCKGEERYDLLSDDVVVVRRVHLEGAVVRPKVDGGCDARYATFVHLAAVSFEAMQEFRSGAYHLGCLGTAYGKFEVGILLPVAEEERELCEETVVDVAHQLDGRGTRVPVDAALKIRGASDERFPFLEVVFVLNLRRVQCMHKSVLVGGGGGGGGILTTASRSFLISPTASSPVYCTWAIAPRPIASILSQMA